jgi:formylglycine-generating enzyme required for sulfatase activity
MNVSMNTRVQTRQRSNTQIVLIILALVPALASASGADNAATAVAEQAAGSNALSPQEHSISPHIEQKLIDSMVWVDGGSFMMGSDRPGAWEREQPVHKVTLDGFYIGKYEVTQEIFADVMDWNLSYNQCAECPVNNVSWLQAAIFVDRLRQLTGSDYRLPTEAQWAFAARGGNLSGDYQYAGSNTIDEVAWYVGNAANNSHPVGRKKPNELGLYDMTGNLSEMCADTMELNAYTTEERINPEVGKGNSVQAMTMKVIRGSSYAFPENESLVTMRDGISSNVRMPDIGLRLAKGKE